MQAGSPPEGEKGTNGGGGRVPQTHSGTLVLLRACPSHYMIVKVTVIIIIIMTNLLWNKSYLWGRHCAGVFHIISITPQDKDYRPCFIF